MFRPKDIPYSGISIKKGVMYALLYSFIIPLLLFAPFLIARALNVPLAQQVGLSAKNLYMYLIFVYVLAAMVIYLLIRRELRRRNKTWRDIGIRKFRVMPAFLYIISWPIIVISIAIIIAVIVSLTGVAPPQSEAGRKSLEVPSLIGAVILASLIAPVFEEVIFRGILFRSLVKRYGFIVGLVVSSLIFSLIHLNPAQIATTLVLGPYLCVMYQRLGSIIPGMILHALHNATVTLLLVASL